MVKKNKNRFWPVLSLRKLMQARSDIRKYKSLYIQEFVEHEKAKRQVEVATTETDLYCDLVEFVSSYVLMASTQDELADAKLRYNTFRKIRTKEYAEKRKAMRILTLSVDGKVKCINAW